MTPIPDLLLTTDTFAGPGLPPFMGQPGIACATEDPELFYPEPGEPPTAAKAICSRCRHREPCLDWALTRPETHGIWGGKTTPERTRILTKTGASR